MSETTEIEIFGVKFKVEITGNGRKDGHDMMILTPQGKWRLSRSASSSEEAVFFLRSHPR